MTQKKILVGDPARVELVGDPGRVCLADSEEGRAREILVGDSTWVELAAGMEGLTGCQPREGGTGCSHREGVPGCRVQTQEVSNWLKTQ